MFGGHFLRGQYSSFCVSEMHQIPLAFECNQLNGNLADLWSTELQFSPFCKKINLYNFYVYNRIEIRKIDRNRHY